MQLTILLFIMLALFSTKNAFSQEDGNRYTTLNKEYISKHTFHFNIQKNKFYGEGAKLLEYKISLAQFLILGEYHGSSQISKFTKTLIPVLKENKFDVAVFEIGPNSAKKIRDITKDSENITKDLYNFYTENYFKKIDNTVIPFLDNKGDALFLEDLAKNNFEIWGCDQEFYTAVLFLGDEIVSQVNYRPDFEKIQETWYKAKQDIIALYIKDQNKKIKIFEEIKSNKNFHKFSNFFTEKDTVAFQILNDLTISWDIYTNYRRSHKDRVMLIREYFLKQYSTNEVQKPNSKYFIKIGGLHAGKKAISLGNYDIGALTEELATLNGTKSINIHFKPAYSDNNTEYMKYLHLFTQFGQKDQWTIIDLNSISKDIQNGKISLIGIKQYRDIKEEIDNYDLLIIPPNDYDPTPNYGTMQ
ncbi:hypothetical protein [Flammeovirga kamogawensis]|uniref:Erythromycin esterase family protein n=1 Tax=Flammeovirga kamogawensis TaxID=373891 RepID=A0ABX8GW43_9BACT|nr:hypothetical protein [Flammeovirga kamogawensis]MBB6460979.1 hypothetical protein [Flammeovirga kamogawensis]QWG07551.1 hypothetical protein KM029_01035 [Flammeovirga kamogawensis]TRX69363.1 hypothetical protein EO216_14975 [Flammeovirga kamogawensis]